jgi:hypothetical protein
LWKARNVMVCDDLGAACLTVAVMAKGLRSRNAMVCDAIVGGLVKGDVRAWSSIVCMTQDDGKLEN